MGKEIDLLENYPRAKRDTEQRGKEKTDEDRKIAREFGKEFFDGDRRTGYGGFSYSPKFWQPVVPTFQEYFSLSNSNSILDIGCAKGFMIYDFSKIIPGITVKGIDLSNYAIRNCIEDMKEHVKVADARKLPFEDNSFDVVISINTIHNLDRGGCIQSLKEIERVGRGKSFVTVDAFTNEEEEKKMNAWNLTAKTILHVNEWKELFSEASYQGDYYWFMP